MFIQKKFFLGGGGGGRGQTKCIMGDAKVVNAVLVDSLNILQAAKIIPDRSFQSSLTQAR